MKNLRFQWIGEKIEIPKNQKKRIKSKIKSELNGRIVKSLFVVKNKFYNLYSLNSFSESLIRLSKNHEVISEFNIEKGDYFVGEFQFEGHNVIFVINVGSLVFIDKEYCIYTKSGTLIMKTKKM